MPIEHPKDGELSFNVEEAAAWLTERGLRTAVGSLNSMRTNGCGPLSFKFGKRVYYRESALRSYLLSKLTPDVSSTSELRKTKRLLIEDQSAARSNGKGE
jgi:hypothetical protein